jgi:hypothetical protein
MRSENLEIITPINRILDFRFDYVKAGVDVLLWVQICYISYADENFRFTPTDWSGNNQLI